MSDEIFETAAGEAAPGSEFRARSDRQAAMVARDAVMPGLCDSPQLAPTDDAGDAPAGRPASGTRPPPDAADSGLSCAEDGAPDAVDRLPACLSSGQSASQPARIISSSGRRGSSVTAAEWSSYGLIEDLQARPCPYLPGDVGALPPNLLFPLFGPPRWDEAGHLLPPHHLCGDFIPEQYVPPADFEWPEYTGVAAQLFDLGIRNVNLLQYGGYICLCCGSEVRFCSAKQNREGVVFMFYECTVCYTSNYPQRWRTFGWCEVQCEVLHSATSFRFTGGIAMGINQFCFCHHTCGKYGRYPPVHVSATIIDGPDQDFPLVDVTSSTFVPFCPRRESRNGIVPSRRSSRASRSGLTTTLGCRPCSNITWTHPTDMEGFCTVATILPSRRHRLVYSTRCHFWRPFLVAGANDLEVD
jgi:hypothetical protein